jgi:hypothetical protein
MITMVVPTSPAAEGGLRRYDVVTEMKVTSAICLLLVHQLCLSQPINRLQGYHCVAIVRDMHCA